ncbi:metal ABC transporter permease [Micromonospora tulbaghiae]|uniref:metal ABC transporter permease n=1 Tax=Micromonospora tulbaghiae TaxID=479978 RepID=UPI003EB9C3BC
MRLLGRRHPALDLVVAPAATARSWTDHLTPMTTLAVTFGVGSGLGGLRLSWYAEVAVGGSISLAATALLRGSLAAAPLRDRLRATRRAAA